MTPPPRVVAPAPARTAAAAPASYPRFAQPPERSGSGVWITVLILLLAMAIGGGAYLYYHGPDTASAQPVSASIPAPPDDLTIQTEVQRILGSSDSTRNASFDVKVERGVVTLTGKTNRQNEADMAGALAKGVAGVTAVKNQIEVEKPATEPAVAEKPAARPSTTPDGESPARRQQLREESGNKRRAMELVRQGKAQVDSGDYGAAVETFQQALALDPSNALARMGLGKAQKAKQTEDDIMKRRR
jgi:hypothetical protein